MWLNDKKWLNEPVDIIYWYPRNGWLLWFIIMDTNPRAIVALSDGQLLDVPWHNLSTKRTGSTK